MTIPTKISNTFSLREPSSLNLRKFESYDIEHEIRMRYIRPDEIHINEFNKLDPEEQVISKLKGFKSVTDEQLDARSNPLSVSSLITKKACEVLSEKLMAKQVNRNYDDYFKTTKR